MTQPKSGAGADRDRSRNASEARPVRPAPEGQEDKSCPLCGLPHDPDARCESCGLTPEFGPDRPNPFAGATLWLMIGVLVVVFALTLLVVGLTA